MVSSKNNSMCLPPYINKKFTYCTGLRIKIVTPAICELNSGQNSNNSIISYLSIYSKIYSNSYYIQAGINDTFVVVWYFKYLYNTARPNQLDHRLATILCTPRFPAYPSGHSAISGCAARILSYFFPAKSSQLNRLAEQNAYSRLLAGVHFPSDNDHGLILGRQVGDIVVDVLRNERDAELRPIGRRKKTSKRGKCSCRKSKSGS
jgi:hypothetical protein